MKIDIHILTNSAGVFSDTAGVKSPEGEYSPPVIAFSHLLQSTIDSNSSHDKNLNTKNSTSSENLTPTIHTGDSHLSDHIVNQPDTMHQTENMFATALQTPAIIGYKPNEHSANIGHKTLKISQPYFNIQDKAIITPHFLTHSTIEKNSINNGNTIDELPFSNSEHIINPPQKAENFTKKNISATATGKENLVEIESMVRDFSDSMKVQTKGKVNINLLASRSDDVQVRIDISNAANDEIPHIMEMIIQNLWIPMQQKNQQPGLNNLDDALTIRYEQNNAETNFEQILHTEYQITSDDNVQIKNQTHPKSNHVNLKNDMRSESSAYNIYHQVKTDSDADSAVNSSDRSKQDSMIQEHKQVKSDYSTELHIDTVEKQRPVSTNSQESLRYNTFDETENAHHISYKTTDNIQNDDIKMFNESGFNKKPTKPLEDNSSKESVQVKGSHSEKTEYISSTNRKLPTPTFSAIPDSDINALQSYIKKLFPDPSTKVGSSEDKENIQISENSVSLLVAKEPVTSNNQKKSLEIFDTSFIVNNDQKQGNIQNTKENILTANEKNIPASGLTNQIHQEKSQVHELYDEKKKMNESYVHKNNAQTNSPKNLSATIDTTLHDKLQDSRLNSPDIHYTLSESEIVQSRTEDKIVESKTIYPKSTKTINNSQENIERIVINYTGDEKKEEGDSSVLNNSIVSNGKKNTSYGKDVISPNYRGANIINSTSQQDFEKEIIEKSGLSELKNYGEQLRPNVSNVKTVDERNKQDFIHTVKQSATNTPINQNQGDSSNTNSKVTAQFSSNSDNEISGLPTKKILHKELVHINSEEVQKINTIIDAKNIDSVDVSKHNSDSDKNTTIPKKITINTILNDESLQMTDDSSVKVDYYTAKVKESNSENTSIGLASEVQNRATEEVELAIESEQKPIIRGEQQRAAVENVAEQSDNPIMRKYSSLNPIQYEKSSNLSDETSENINVPDVKSIVDNRENTSSQTSQNEQESPSEKVIFVKESKDVSKNHGDQRGSTVNNEEHKSDYSAVTQRTSENLLQSTLSAETNDNSSNALYNQEKNNEHSSGRTSQTSQNEQESPLEKVIFVKESKDISKNHSNQQNITVKNVADQNDYSAVKQSPSLHPIQNEKLVKATKDDSANNNQRKTMQNGNSIIQKSNPLPSNFQVPEDIDIYQSNDEINKNTTSHSPLMNGSSVEEVSNIDSTAQSKPLLTVHEENELKSKVDHQAINYTKSSKILQSENQTAFSDKKEFVPPKPLSAKVISAVNVENNAGNSDMSRVPIISEKNSVEKSEDSSQKNISLPSRQKTSAKPENSEVLNTEKTPRRFHNVSPQIQETQYVENLSENTSIPHTFDESRNSIHQDDKSYYEPTNSENDSKVVNTSISEIESHHVSDNEYVELVAKIPPSQKGSETNNLFIAENTINGNSVESVDNRDKAYNISLKTSKLHNDQKHNTISESPQGIAQNKGVIEENISSKQVVSHSSSPNTVVDVVQENTSEPLYSISYDEDKEIIRKTISTENQIPDMLLSDNDVHTHISSLKATSHEKKLLNQIAENTTISTFLPIDKPVSDSVKTIQSRKTLEGTSQNNVRENVGSHAITYNDITTENNTLNQQNLHTPKTTSFKNKTVSATNRVNSDNIETEILNKVSISEKKYNDVSDETSVVSKSSNISTEKSHNKIYDKPHSVISTLFGNDDDSETVKKFDTSESAEKDEDSIPHIISETKTVTSTNVLNDDRNLHPPLQTTDGTVYVLKNKNLDNAAIVITPPSELQAPGQAIPNTAIALHSIIEKASSVGVPVKNIVFKIRYTDAVSSESKGNISQTGNKKSGTQGDVHLPKINTLHNEGTAYHITSKASAKSHDSQEMSGMINKGIASNYINGEAEKKSDKKVTVSSDHNSNALMVEGAIKKSENTSQDNSAKQDNHLSKKDSLSYRTSLKNSLSHDILAKSVQFSDVIAPAVSERGNTVQKESANVTRSNNDVPINNVSHSSKHDSLDAEAELQTTLSQNSGQSLAVPDTFSQSVITENNNSTSREGIINPQSVHIQTPQKSGVATIKKGNSMETTEPIPVHHFAEKAHEYINSKSQGDGTVRMVLQPEELGTVIVRYSTQSTDAQLHIQVDSQQTKQIIESQLPQLKDQFGKQGMPLDNVEVSVRKKEEEMSNNSQYSHNRQGQSQQDQESRQQFTRSFKYAADARKAQTTVNYNSSAFNRIFQSQR